MSTDQLPFPPYPDQSGQAAPPGPPKSNQIFPPRIRMGQSAKSYDGAQNNETPAAFGGALNDGTPAASFNDEATQAFHPDVPQVSFPQGGISPSGFAQPGATTSQFQAGPSQFNPSGAWNNGENQSTSGQFGAVTRQLGNTGMLPGPGTTGQLPGAYSGDTGMLKLNQAVKVVRIPVAGKPGEYKTGILPVLTQPTTGALPPPAQAQNTDKKSQAKVLLLIALVLVLLVGSGSYLLLRASGRSTSTAQQNSQTGGQQTDVNAVATANAQATATAVAEASLIVSDPLSSPIHSWSQGTYNNISYSFVNGAYHIRQNGKFLGYALMPAEQSLPKNFTYTLTMQNVNYDKGNSNALSFYCMIFNYQSSNGRAAFYALRVNNSDNISYEIDKFDNRHIGNNDNPWQQLYPNPNNSAGQGKGNGKEFKGPHQPNVYSVTSLNGTLSFSVNGVKIGSVKDTSFTGGAIGMGVNQAGTEAAFSNLYLYSN
ncbi:MAG: hypothetical protein JOZ18_08925 [Chloroflexi bacterium]|nr:hypothetical protein [Chloroflexota bacterium]